MKTKKKQQAVRTWHPIKTAPKSLLLEVDLWLDIPASPRSMGWADSFRVTDAYYRDGKWMHRHNGSEKELYAGYITHWMPVPQPPTP